MAVGRRDTSNTTVNPEEQEEEEEQLEEQENAHTVTRPAIRRLNAGRSIQRRLLIGSRRRPGRWPGLHWMERQLSLASLIPSPWKQSRRKKSNQDKEGRKTRQIQETWIIDQLNKEEVSLVTFHLMFPIREKYSYWHLDGKTNEDVIREEEIQIIRDWRSMDNVGPREVRRTGYGFGLEDI